MDAKKVKPVAQSASTSIERKLKSGHRQSPNQQMVMINQTPIPVDKYANIQQYYHHEGAHPILVANGNINYYNGTKPSDFQSQNTGVLNPSQVNQIKTITGQKSNQVL